ncbi:MAG TPA: tetratricopeptide repeat protein [Blastocatellia bacterium]|nr:tetratricopeptide repeat protein [Blastocatellia bacterium]
MGKRFYKFGEFCIDAAKRVLLRGEAIVPLTRKAFDTLLVLVENRGELLEKEELMKRVWPDSFVEENNLNQSISALRKALGETAAAQNYIATVSKRGYRFIAEVKEFFEEDAPGEQAFEKDAAINAIAVLPFKSLSLEKTDEYLGLGMADSLITRLSNIRQIVVRPTSAVLKYTASSQDPISAGRELRVRSVLEGSVRRAAERIRVTVQLVSIPDGASLWAAKFDESFTDIFAVEDSISERVAEALTLKLTSEEKSLLTKRYTENAEAHRLYIKGRYYASRLTREGFDKGIECFNQAIALDPSYALAYEGLAYYYLESLDLLLPPNEAMPRAREAAKKALEIDEHIAESHTTLAIVKFYYDWDWAGAERLYRQAIELSPNNAYALTYYGFYLIFMERFDEASLVLERIRELDPLSLENNVIVGGNYFFARRYDEAIEQFRKVIAMDANYWLARVNLGRAYEQTGAIADAIAEFEKARLLGGSIPETLGDLGRAYAVAGKSDEARRVLEELNERSKTDYVAPYNFAVIYTGLGERDEAFAWLDKAYEARSWYLTWLKVDPALDSLRSDERFQDLLNRVGF